MKKNNLRLMCMTSVFSALIFVVTAYLHIPSHLGYIHIGDGFIYLAACILPAPYAVFASAAGAALADLLTGYAVWAPGSAIIKAVTAVLFSCKGAKILSARNKLMLAPAAIVCAGGYYLYQGLIFGSFRAALSGTPGSLVQSVASTIAFLLISIYMDKLKLKDKLTEGFKL